MALRGILSASFSFVCSLDNMLSTTPDVTLVSVRKMFGYEDRGDCDTVNYWQNLRLILICCLLIVLSRGSYNRHFHPLRRFPGPFWASITDFYKIYIIATRHVPRFEMELHQKYGTLILQTRLTQNKC